LQAPAGTDHRAPDHNPSDALRSWIFWRRRRLPRERAKENRITTRVIWRRNSLRGELHARSKVLASEGFWQVRIANCWRMFFVTFAKFCSIPSGIANSWRCS
jgi:hypothetical protein